MSDGPPVPRWARAAAVLLGAALYALALPPWNYAALAWVTLVPLLLAIRGRSVWTGLCFGLLYGCTFGWTVTGWSLEAVMRYFGIGLPLAVLGLSVFYVVIFIPNFGLFGAGAALFLRREPSWAGRLGLSALWSAAELIRCRLVGQPWGLLGYSQWAHTGIIQIAALTGVYGVSFLLVLGNVVVAEAISEVSESRRLRPGILRITVVATAIAAIWANGALLARRGPTGGFLGRSVAIVQTNVPPAFEWTRSYADRQLYAHIQATDQLPKNANPALIVWPENAVTEYLESDPMLAAQLAELAARHHADLLFGAPRYEAGRTFNSIRLITRDGRNGGYYDKQHLVLLAESGLLAEPPPSDRNESPRAFSPGDGPAVLNSFVPIGVSICHEVIYPELTNQAVRAGAQLLVNVSNDGWLDAGSGVASRQHFAMAIFRAVETRRYLVRGAISGISAVVDPYGHVVHALEPHTTGVVMAGVAGRDTITPYVRLGDLFASTCGLVVVGLLTPRRSWSDRRRRDLASAPSVSS